jgi:hypothetical protein
MYEYKQEHYRFVRNTGLRRSDFADEPNAKPEDWIVLVAALVILICVVVLE